MSGLSASDALHKLGLIEGALDAFCATAPRAVVEFGGREAIQRASQMTCIGPVPRLSIERWSRFAAEHADTWKYGASNLVERARQGAEATDRGSPSARGLGFGTLSR